MAKNSAKARAARTRFKKAAKACSKAKGKFQTCMKKKLKRKKR